jgi:hypothetical protein
LLCIGDYRDSGVSVYDQDGGLWRIYESIFEHDDTISVIIPIDIILGDVYDENNALKLKLIKSN